ncbi:uncharacterized protein VNE69_11045 [Vairimorpha necatrix]|uniref:Uncharacterized protein n=1 Tax=Vairimorpha necatrix TaxID=6039 RepID=A0AAX4JG11_9MICR
MDIFKIFTSILFVLGHLHRHAYDNLYTVINSKIKNKDYFEIDVKKTYFRVNLIFDCDRNELNAITVCNSPFINKTEAVNRFKINCAEKPSQDIVREIEENLLGYCKYMNPDYIVVTYNPAYCENPVFLQIINFLIQKNLTLKNRINRPSVLYEYIIENTSSWILMFLNIYKQQHNKDNSRPESFLTYSIKENISFITFCIENKNIKYLFEINAEEIYKEGVSTRVDRKTQKSNEIDVKISEYFFKLYKNVYIDIDYRYSKPFFEFHTFDKIDFISGSLCIEILYDKICFTQRHFTYFFNPNEITSLFENRDYDENEWIREFKEVFGKIRAIDEIDKRRIGIEMFFRLIKYHNKVTFLLEKIFSAHGSPLNVLLAHLLISERLINENSLKILIIKGEDFNKEKKIQLCKEIEKNLLKFICRSSSFMIKICLFIEAEKYINGVSTKKDPEFELLNIIGDLIRLKEKKHNIIENIQSNLSLCKNKIDIITIYEELVKNHLQDYKNNKRDLWKTVFEIASLFTGFETTRCDIKDYKFQASKEYIISKCVLEKYEVEKNNEIIRKKLFENNRDRKAVEEIKNILQRLNLKYLANELNKLKDEALNKQLVDLCNEMGSKKFEDDLIQKGTTCIEEKFNYKNLKKELNEEFDAFWDREYANGEKTNFNYDIKSNKFWIEEYKSDEKEKLHYEIQINILKNIKNNSKHYLLETLETIFYNEIKNDLVMIENGEKNLRTLKKLLSKNDLHKALTGLGGCKLHDCLVATLKNNDN